jgi:hypothetical protein
MLRGQWYELASEPYASSALRALLSELRDRQAISPLAAEVRVRAGCAPRGVSHLRAQIDRIAVELMEAAGASAPALASHEFAGQTLLVRAALTRGRAVCADRAGRR